MLLNHETPVGAEFSGAPRRPTQQGLNSLLRQAFGSPLPPNMNVHTNPDFARQLGFRTPVIPGAITGSYLVSLMIDLFGEGWFGAGKVSLKYVRAVEPGDTIVAHARVSAKQADRSGVRFSLDIWCRNQQGQTVITGQAGGSVPRGV